MTFGSRDSPPQAMGAIGVTWEGSFPETDGGDAMEHVLEIENS